MKQYQCHKRVKAAQITGVEMGPVLPALGSYGVTKITAGDLVEYEDGYRSISSKAAFEEGYSEIEEQAA
jgi:hypothetical protein